MRISLHVAGWLQFRARSDLPPVSDEAAYEAHFRMMPKLCHFSGTLDVA